MKTRRKKRKSAGVDFKGLEHLKNDFPDIKACMETITDYRISTGIAPVSVTKQSIIKYQEMRKEILSLSNIYPEIWLIYDRLPKRIWRYNDKKFTSYFYIALLITAVLIMMFNLELGIDVLDRFDGGIDAIYILLAFFQFPVYLLLKRFFCKRIEKIEGLLLDLNDMMNDRMKNSRSVT